MFFLFMCKIKIIDQVGAIESVKAASDIYSPVSGEIIDVNETLSDEPSLINSSPEEDGKWSQSDVEKKK